MFSKHFQIVLTKIYFLESLECSENIYFIRRENILKILSFPNFCLGMYINYEIWTL